MSMGTSSQRELFNTIDWINGQTDALVAIVKSLTPIPGELGDLFIYAIPDKTYTPKIFYHPPPSREQKSLVLEITPPIPMAEAVKPRLKRMRDDAFRKFQVPATPTLTYFTLPDIFPFTAMIVPALSVLFFALFGWGYYADTFRSEIVRRGGHGLLPAATGLAAFIHLVFYPIYMTYNLRRHHVPLVPAVSLLPPSLSSLRGPLPSIGRCVHFEQDLTAITGTQLKWMAMTVVLGFASVNEFWECIMHERIRHIYRRTDVGEIGPRKPATTATPTSPVPDAKKKQ